MMKLLAILPGLALLLAPSSLSAGDEVEIPLTDVPEVVLAAALDAMPGIELTEAEFEMERGQRIYELEGRLDGVEYEIEVSSAGEVIEVEED
ncbi:MAG: PepSY domain-containing protein [Gammaproteobacteria bacterium]|nr:PepSY domain-containing protein [Gammaproteobacteria bacterium]